MSAAGGPSPERVLDARIDEWRTFVLRHRAVTADDVDELEDHLRGQAADLARSGLDDDEAFLVAIRRLGDLDAVTAEYAREHSERLWRQLAVAPADAARSRELVLVAVLAVAAGAALRLAAWLLSSEGPFAVVDDSLLVRNAAFVVAPFAIAYFAAKRRLSAAGIGAVAALLAAIAVFANVYPLDPAGDSIALSAVHSHVLVWAVLGIAYMGGRWRSDARRMDFVRFTGEVAVYLVLLALGGGVLLLITTGIFALAGVGIPDEVLVWLACLAAPAACLVAAWLVEAKQDVVENIAPVLTRVFTPLMAVMLVALLASLAVAGGPGEVDRTLLILMDGVLVLVLALVLYAVSARDPLAPSGPFDLVQLVMLVAAILVDAVMLATMLARIAEFGFSANKTVALGLNLLLLVHLARHTQLLLGFVRGHTPFVRLERWQTRYLPVYAVWAALVLVAVPPLFGFA